jgi:hypothetical protein
MRADETDALMVGKVFNKENYGLLVIDSKLKTLQMSIKNIDGNVVSSVDLKL